MDITEVALSKQAIRDLKTVPHYIVKKLQAWIDAIEHEGLLTTRKISGYHDEPLKGDRQGQRSIRLNKQWRAIYSIINTKIEFLLIEEVTPHDY